MISLFDTKKDATELPAETKTCKAYLVCDHDLIPLSLRKEG
jgi:hypothetical protein